MTKLNWKHYTLGFITLCIVGSIFSEPTAEQKSENIAAYNEARAEQLKVQQELDGVNCKKDKQAIIGELQARTLKCGWGKPQSVNRTAFGSSTNPTIREQWVYGNGNYLYFVDGRLTAVQN